MYVEHVTKYFVVSFNYVTPTLERTAVFYMRDKVLSLKIPLKWTKLMAELRHSCTAAAN